MQSTVRPSIIIALLLGCVLLHSSTSGNSDNDVNLDDYDGNDTETKIRRVQNEDEISKEVLQKRKEWALSKYLLEILKQTSSTERPAAHDVEQFYASTTQVYSMTNNTEFDNTTRDINYVESLVEKIKVLEESLQMLNSSWELRLKRLESRLDILEKNRTSANLTSKRCPALHFNINHLVATVLNEVYESPNVIPPVMTHNTIVYFSCKDTRRNVFRLSRQDTMTCLLGEWAGNFPSCKIFLRDGQNICKLPAREGQCYRYRRLWYYNNSLRTCSTFLYSGCAGNFNRFRTKSECEHVCSSHNSTE